MGLMSTIWAHCDNYCREREDRGKDNPILTLTTIGITVNPYNRDEEVSHD